MFRPTIIALMVVMSIIVVVVIKWSGDSAYNSIATIVNIIDFGSIGDMFGSLSYSLVILDLRSIQDTTNLIKAFNCKDPMQQWNRNYFSSAMQSINP